MGKSISEILRSINSDVAELNQVLAPLLTLFKEPVPGPVSKPLFPELEEAAHVPSPARKLQGVYMALVRDLSESDKAAVRVVRKESGIEAAISLARSF